MKKILLGLSTIILLNISTFGQLSGTYLIPDYSGPGFTSVYSAVNALNSQGISGNVTFLVAAGFTESTEVPIILTATGYPGSEIVFQKNGSGPNPKITRGDGGSLSPSVLGAQGDAVIIIEGSDFVTFNGIDVAATNSGIEYGYYLRKASGTDGCKSVAILNSSITMTQGTNHFIIGIYCSNNTASSHTNSNEGVTVTSNGGRHENVKITGNTIQNVFWGISVRGYNHTTSPYDLYDQHFEIGTVDSGNIIMNFAGYSSFMAAYGIHAMYHDNLNISYNTINNMAGGGSPFTWLGFGIYHASTTNGNGTYCHNIINLTSSDDGIYGVYFGNPGTSEHFINNNEIILSITTNGAATHISNSTSVGSATINYNSFSYGDFASSSPSYLINCGNNINNLTCIGNYTSGVINKTGEGTFYGLRFSPLSSSIGTCLVQDNNFSNIVLTGASEFRGISAFSTSSQTTYFVTGNTISNITGGTGNMYGIYTGFEFPGSQVMNNTVSGLTTSGSGLIQGYRVGTSVYGTLHLAGNIACNLINSGSGTVTGIYQFGGTDGIIHSYNNQVFGLSGSDPTSLIYGLYQNKDTAYIYNNFISDLKAPAGTGENAITGLYIGSEVNLAGVFHNTIYLDAYSSSVTTFGTSGVFLHTDAIVILRNNIIVNLSIPGPSGLTVAFRRNDVNLTKYHVASNTNDFYAGTPAANHLIYYDGTNSEQTIEDFKVRVSPRDPISISENPHFINSITTPYDLHIDPAYSTLLESGGRIVDWPFYITTDFDGDLRHASLPDIGADEFDGFYATCTQPVPGYTMSSEINVCYGHAFVLYMENTVPGTGISYQWQSSVDGSAYEDIIDANDETCVLNADTTLYYRCLVTCLNGPASATSTPLQITVFKNEIISTTPDVRCGIGTVVMEAVSNPGATITWYDIPEGGVPLGTGSPWETPAINSTQTYWVAAETPTASQNYVIIGSGTASSYSALVTPYCTEYEDGKHQFLFLAGELANVGLYEGNITSLALDIVEVGSPAMKNFGVYMGQSPTVTQLTTTYETGLTIVYATDAYIPPGIGWQEINFTTPFYWDGSSNLIMQICFGNSFPNFSSSVRYSTTSFHSHHYGYQDNGTGCSMTAPTYHNVNFARANMRFRGACAVTCSSPRTAVEATVTEPPELAITGDHNLCNNTYTVLSVNSPIEHYDLYTWDPASGLFTDPDLTIPYVEDQNASMVFLKLASVGPVSYTCTGSNSVSECVNQAICIVTLLDSPSPVMINPDTAYADGAIHQLEAIGGMKTEDHTLGTNTTVTSQTGVTPYSSYYENVRKQYLLLASELQALNIMAGEINSVSFQVTTSGSGLYPQLNYVIKMAHTDNIEITGAYGNPSGDWTMVYFNPSELAPPVGWKIHIFDVPFVWDGVSNVLIDICHENDPDNTCPSCWSSNSSVAYTATTFNSVYGRYNDNNPACDVLPASSISSYYYKYRPNMKLNISVAGDITWTPHVDLYLDQNASIPYTGEVTQIVYASPVAPVTYHATANLLNGCTSTGDCEFVIYHPEIQLDIKVFLEGPHDAGSMTTFLNPNLPLNQPFNPSLPFYGNPAPLWFYEGIESVAEMPPNIVDWVLVEVRDALTAQSAGPSTMIGKKAALLSESGQIMDTDGGLLTITAQVTQGLFVVVYHRNHLPVMSSLPLSQFSGIYSWDFTDGISQAYGNILKVLTEGYTGMFGGDADGNGFIESGDLIFNWHDKAGETGYLAVDFNLDGQVDNQDKNDIWVPNKGVQCWVQSSAQNLMFYQVDSDFDGM
jgi:hypothetical protein